MTKLPRIAGLGVLALGLLLVALPVFAQEGDEDIRKEIEALKQGQQNIQKQLQEIKKLLQQQQRPAAPQGPKVKDVVFNLGNNDVLGDAGAALTLIEFTDYQ
jgi:protein-disulfide isomerase